MITPKIYVLDICIIVYICVSVILLSASVRSPADRIWKGYAVLAADADIPEQTVLTEAAGEGMDGVLSLSTQAALPVSKFAPVQAVPGENAGLHYSYRDGRDRYFYDRTGEYRLYYVPDKYSSRLPALARRLDGTSEKSVFVPETGRAFPWRTAGLCGAVWALLILLAGSRFPVSAGGVPFALWFAAFPFPSAAAALCMTLYALFLADLSCGGRKRLTHMAEFPYAATLITASAAVSFGCSAVSGMWYLAACAQSAGILFVLRRLRARHCPTAAAGQPCPVSAGVCLKKRIMILVPLCAAALIFAGVQGGEGAVNVPDIALPAPASSPRSGDAVDMEGYTAHCADAGIPQRQESRLPDLSDYITWKWNTDVFAYRPLGSVSPQRPSEGDNVVIPTYYMDAGRIRQSFISVFTFDSDFLASAVKEINSKYIPSVEAMLVMQGKFVYTVYAPMHGLVRQPGNDRRAKVFVFAALVSMATMSCIFLFGKRYGGNI